MTTIEEVARSMQSPSRKVEVRGDGRARFLYAVTAERAVEMAECDGGWWVELWRNEEDKAVRESTVRDVIEATAAAMRWLDHGL
jgi:hypothetical protein